MARLSDSFRASIAYKKLVGLTNTNVSDAFFNEGIPSDLILDTQRILNQVPNNSSGTKTTQTWGVTYDSKPLEIVEFDLDQIDSSGESFHLKFPSDYDGSFGTGVQGDRFTNTSAFIVAPKYNTDPISNEGYNYELILDSEGGITVGQGELSDGVAWQLDDKSGVVFGNGDMTSISTSIRPEFVKGSANSASSPYDTVRAIVYTGNTLREELTSISTGSVSAPGNANDVVLSDGSNFVTASTGEFKFNGNGSIEAGSAVDATGNFAGSIGDHTKAAAVGSVSIGRYNVENKRIDPSTGSPEPVNSTNPTSTDQVFIVGNGASGSRSNSFFIRRNGATDIGGTLRVRDDATFDQTLLASGGLSTGADSITLNKNGTTNDGDNNLFGLEAVRGTSSTPLPNARLVFDESDNTWKAGTVGSLTSITAAAAGSTDQIQYNVNGQLSADANFTFDPDNDAFTVGNRNTNTIGTRSVVLGGTGTDSNLAGGANAVAQGLGTTADGAQSFAAGQQTDTTIQNGFVVGEYNNNSFANTASDQRMFIVGNGSVGSRSDAFWVKRNGNAKVSGDFTAQTLTETSSIRYKTNVHDVGNEIANIMNLRPVEYERKESGRKEKGLIAEEVAEVYPEFVQSDERGPESVNYSRMVSVLVEAVQELKSQKDTLESKVEELQNKL